MGEVMRLCPRMGSEPSWEETRESGPVRIQ